MAAAAQARLAEVRAAADADVRGVGMACAAREAKRADLHAQQIQVSHGRCVTCGAQMGHIIWLCRNLLCSR